MICPGCGSDLPSGKGAPPPGAGFRASPDCFQLYGEVASYGAMHEELERWHQTCVDAYRAQHVGPGTPALALSFALNGLYLVLERGFSGIEARVAHGYLARTVESWDLVPPPPEPEWSITVFDVALATTPADHAARVEEWGRSVWSQWSHVHTHIADLTDHQLTGWRPR